MTFDLRRILAAAHPPEDLEVGRLNLGIRFEDMLRRCWKTPPPFTEDQIIEMRRCFVAGALTVVQMLREEGFDLEDLQHECNLFHSLMKNGKA